jgi:hypothetical protein
VPVNTAGHVKAWNLDRAGYDHAAYAFLDWVTPSTHCTVYRSGGWGTEFGLKIDSRWVALPAGSSLGWGGFVTD